MASSRRRFLTTIGAAAAGAGVSSTARAATPTGAHTGKALPRDAFSPSELLERHVRQTNAAASAAAAGAQSSERRMPSQAEVESWYRDLRNWGRWGDDDQKGAVNLITPERARRRPASSATAAGSR